MTRGFVGMLIVATLAALAVATLAALAVATLAALAVPAYAVADESLSATGSITYTWQGDPARGCAAAGLCGVRGELIVQPQGDTGAIALRGTVDIPIFSPALTVRAVGPGGVCVDVPEGVPGSDLFVTRRGHGRLVGRIEPPFSSSRCAGPTSHDLARLTFPVRRFGARRPSYDLRVSRSFVAGPFTGTFASTLVLRPSTGGGGSSSQSFPGLPAPPRHKVLVERVALRYRVASLPSALDTAFSGEPDPFCAAFAAAEPRAPSRSLSPGSLGPSSSPPRAWWATGWARAERWPI